MLSSPGLNPRTTVGPGRDATAKSELASRFLLITTRGYWKRLAMAKEWLFVSAKAAKKLSQGDEAIVYLTAHRGESAIGGLVRIGGAVQPIQGNKTGLMYGIYPFRIPIDVLAVCEPPIPFQQVRGQLSFIPKTPSWGGVLQGQPAKLIPERDFEILRRAVLDTRRA